jgi:hypothetical protein
MNFFVSNGPACMGYFGETPWMMFIKPQNEDHGYEPNTPKFWREQLGIEMGTGQFPWCRPDQRIVWKSDDYENLIEAWEDWEGVPMVRCPSTLELASSANGRIHLND